MRLGTSHQKTAVQQRSDKLVKHIAQEMCVGESETLLIL